MGGPAKARVVVLPEEAEWLRRQLADPVAARGLQERTGITVKRNWDALIQSVLGGRPTAHEWARLFGDRRVGCEGRDAQLTASDYDALGTLRMLHAAPGGRRLLDAMLVLIRAVVDVVGRTSG